MTRSNTLDTIAVLDEHQMNDLSNDPEKEHSISSSTTSDWKVFVHPQGSIYFSNGQIIADQDIRDPEILSGIRYSSSFLGLDAWDSEGSEKDMEVQLNVSNRGQWNLALFVNHKHCIAAHAYEKARDGAFANMDPETRQ